LYCEPGGRMEEDAAEFIAAKKFSKPVIAFMAGKFVENMPVGTPFGHAGAIIEGGLGKPSAKIRSLKAGRGAESPTGSTTYLPWCKELTRLNSRAGSRKVA
jgi:succinyl-CoA synthetase alpha subunit